MENLAHFNRDLVPERVVPAMASGAYGSFTVTHDISRWSKAKVFSEIGRKTACFVRFSSACGGDGSAGNERHPRGFACKFFTEDGNWDIVGSSAPVLFTRDPQTLDDFIQARERAAQTGLESPPTMWDFWSRSPESLHLLTILFSDRGAALGYRHMNGYSLHTYTLVNANEERVWCKLHFKTLQRIRNFQSEIGAANLVKDPGQARRDLFEAIENGSFPQWRVCVQVMTEAEAEKFEYNPFDPTKVWPQGRFLPHEVGILELNRNPAGDAEVEQTAFDPSHLIPGIGDSSGDRYNPRHDNDDYTQPGNLFRVMTSGDRARLIDNLVASLMPVPERIQKKQIVHFYMADPAYGKRVADGLGLSLDEILSAHPPSS